MLTKKRGRLLIYVDLTLLLRVNDSKKRVLHIFLIKLSEMPSRSNCRGRMVRIPFLWVVDRVYSWEHARMHMIPFVRMSMNVLVYLCQCRG